MLDVNCAENQPDVKNIQKYQYNETPKLPRHQRNIKKVIPKDKKKANHNLLCAKNIYTEQSCLSQVF